jgi:hypothetical protein
MSTVTGDITVTVLFHADFEYHGYFFLKQLLQSEIIKYHPFYVTFYRNSLSIEIFFILIFLNASKL